MIGSSGTMTIFGACLDSTTQVSIQNAGSSNAVTLGAVTPLGWGEVQVQYSVAAGSAPETAVLTVSTSGGSVTASLQVVPSLPYISAVIPDVWPAGQQTPVTISGAGFGTSPLTGCSLSNLQVSSSSSVIFCVTGWSDGAIQGTATVAANDPGETVALSVTGGSYGLDFAPPPSAGQTSNRVQAQAGGTACTSASIVEETDSPGILPIYNPATIRQGFAPVFQATVSPPNCAIQWSVTGPGSIIGPSTSSLLTVNGNASGTLYIAVASAVGLSQTVVPVKPQQNLTITAVILQDSNGNNAATTADYVRSDIANANSVWSQASIQFSLANSSVVYLESTTYLNTISDSQRQQLTQIPQFHGTGTFVVYYVKGCADQSGLFGQTYPTGVVICMANRTNSTLNLITTLAHELGHAQGLGHVTQNPPINLMDSNPTNKLEADITIAQVSSLIGTSTQ